MKQRKRKKAAALLTASCLVLSLLAGIPGNAHVHAYAAETDAAAAASDATASGAAAPGALIAANPASDPVTVHTDSTETLVITQEMVDGTGKVTVTGGEYAKVTVTTGLDAKQLTLIGVTAQELVLGGGSSYTLTLIGGKAGRLTVASAAQPEPSLDELMEQLKASDDPVGVFTAYQALVAENKRLSVLGVTVAAKQGATVDAVTLAGSATLDLAGAATKQVSVQTDGISPEMTVKLSHFEGALSVEQKNHVNDYWNFVRVDVNDCAVSDLTIAGGGAGNIRINARDTEIRRTEVYGKASVTLDADTQELTVAEDAQGVSLALYGAVGTLSLEGSKSKVSVAACASVKEAVIKGDETRLTGSGRVEAATILGKDVAVGTSGTAVEGENHYVPSASTSSSTRPSTRPTSTPTPKPEEPTTTPTPQVAEKPHVHTWSRAEATCTEAVVCTDPECGFVKEEAKGHTVAEWTDAATKTVCVYERTGECTTCGETVTNGTVTKHGGTTLTVPTEATCRSAGVKTYTCTDCGQTVRTEEYSNPDAHSWGNEKEKNGRTIYTCSLCGATKATVGMGEDGIESDDLAADLQDTEIVLGGASVKLDGAALQTVASATETVSGSALTLKISVDTLTEQQKAETIQSLPEEYQAYEEEIAGGDIYDFSLTVNDETVSDFRGTVTIRLPYTLGEGEDPSSITVWYLTDAGAVEPVEGAVYSDGYVTFETSHFSYYTVVRLIQKVICALFDHQFVTDASATTEATCTTGGSTVSVCSRCGETKVTKTNATGHNMQPDEEKEATCTESGYRTLKCANGCGYTVSEVEEPLGHSWDKEEPTCGDAVVCTRCWLPDPERLATGKHQFGTDGICTVCLQSTTCKHEGIISGKAIELVEGAVSCTDGVLLETYCDDCGQKLGTEVVTYAHWGTSVDEADLSAYDGIEGSVVLFIRCLCGEQEWIAFTHHAWDYDSEEGWEDEETGAWNFKQVFRCVAEEDCPVRYVYSSVTEPAEHCMGVEHHRFQAWYGDTLVKEWESEKEVEWHRNSYTVKTELREGSTSCEDGVWVTEFCLECGKEIEPQLWDHHHHAVTEKVELPEGTTCGGFFGLEAPCACGEEGDWSVNLYANYTNCRLQETAYEQKDGYDLRTYVCEVCGLKVEEKYQTTPLADCKADVTVTETVYDASGTLLGTLEFVNSESGHHETEVARVRLVKEGGSCEDGVWVTWRCLNCDWESEEELFNEHMHVSSRLVLPEGTCGGWISLWDDCPCGEESAGFDFENPDTVACRFEPVGDWEEVSSDYKSRVRQHTYQCAECGYTFIHEIRAVYDRPNCVMQWQAFLLYDSDGDGECESQIGVSWPSISQIHTYDEQDDSNDVDSTDDNGTAIRTRVVACRYCGKATMTYVWADLTGDGSYYDFPIFEKEAHPDGWWYQREWEYELVDGEYVQVRELYTDAYGNSEEF